MNASTYSKSNTTCHVYLLDDERPRSLRFSAELLAKNAGSTYASLSKCLCDFVVLNDCLDAELLRPCSFERGVFDIPGVAPALAREYPARGVEPGGGTGRAPSVLAECLADRYELDWRDMGGRRLGGGVLRVLAEPLLLVDSTSSS